MPESFELTVPFKGQDRIYTGELHPFGYTYKIVMKVGAATVNFEPDEERRFRALIDPLEAPVPLPEAGLLEAIAAALEESLRD